MNWHIGQLVVSTIDHPQSGRIKGQVFDIKALRSCPCGCGTVLIWNGLYCHSECGMSFMCYCRVTRIYCPDEDGFEDWDCTYAPLQTASEEADMKEAIEESLTQYV